MFQWITLLFLVVCAIAVAGQVHGDFWGIQATYGYGGGGGGGGMMYYRKCVNQQCQYVVGFGNNECDTNVECTVNGQQNTNMNGIEGGGYIPDENDNVNGGYYFNDTINHWSRNYVEKLHYYCDVNGITDSNGNPLYLFRPDDFITRAELVALGLKCKHIQVNVTTANPFPDTYRLAWYGPFVARAKALGWVSGYPDGLFRPNQAVNRAEASKILVLRNFSPSQIIDGIMGFIDTIIGSWYEKYVAFARIQGYIDGYRDAEGNLTGFFGPADNMTRAEAAKLIVNINGF